MTKWCTSAPYKINVGWAERSDAKHSGIKDVGVRFAHRQPTLCVGAVCLQKFYESIVLVDFLEFAFQATLVQMIFQRAPCLGCILRFHRLVVALSAGRAPLIYLIGAGVIAVTEKFLDAG